VLAEQQRKVDPSLPLDFLGTRRCTKACWASDHPEKSVFLFDPLALLTLLLSLLLWKRCRPEIKAFLIAALSLLAIYILFYANITTGAATSPGATDTSPLRYNCWR